MGDEITSVSYGHSGYETPEDEAEERREAREQFRRRILGGIRGQLRKNGGLRCWIAFLMAWCGLLAWSVAWAIHAEVWYKTALVSTVLHFISVAAAVTLLTAMWRFVTLYH
jgi:hypothetical protein